jgi:hypothetical protein
MPNLHLGKSVNVYIYRIQVQTVAALLDIETHWTAYVLGKIYVAKKITKEELLKKSGKCINQAGDYQLKTTLK